MSYCDYFADQLEPDDSVDPNYPDNVGGDGSNITTDGATTAVATAALMFASATLVAIF